MQGRRVASASASPRPASLSHLVAEEDVQRDGGVVARDARLLGQVEDLVLRHDARLVQLLHDHDHDHHQRGARNETSR